MENSHKWNLKNRSKFGLQNKNKLKLNYKQVCFDTIKIQQVFIVKDTSQINQSYVINLKEKIKASKSATSVCL